MYVAGNGGVAGDRRNSVQVLDERQEDGFDVACRNGGRRGVRDEVQEGAEVSDPRAIAAR